MASASPSVVAETIRTSPTVTLPLPSRTSSKLDRLKGDSSKYKVLLKVPKNFITSGLNLFLKPKVSLFTTFKCMQKLKQSLMFSIKSVTAQVKSKKGKKKN
jgi:hypothetical protein